MEQVIIVKMLVVMLLIIADHCYDDGWDVRVAGHVTADHCYDDSSDFAGHGTADH